MTKFGAAFVGGLVVSWAIGARLAASSHLLDRLALVPARAWVIAAVAAGIAFRVALYVRVPDVWHDEAAMIVNVVERTYLQLLQPLTYHEAAPPLFMWMQRWIAEHVGDGLWALRLVPFVASVGALLLLVPATRMLRDGAAPVAMLLMACSPRLLWHSAEAKPYAVDVLIATAVIAVLIVTRHWPLARRITLLAAAAPAIVWSSYPGIFLVAGIALSLLTIALVERQRAGVVAFIALALVVTLAFLPLAAGPIRAQRDEIIYAAWASTFLAGWDPFTVAVWLGRAMIGIADYCFRPLGGLLIVPIAFGIASFVRRGDAAIVAAMLAPLALAAIAGITKQYPFAGARVMIWALPALALLAAEGVGAIVSRLPRRAPLPAAIVIALTVLPPLAFCLREVVSASSRPETFAAAQMVTAARRPDDVIASGAWEIPLLSACGVGQLRAAARSAVAGSGARLVVGARRNARRASRGCCSRGTSRDTPRTP